MNIPALYVHEENFDKKLKSENDKHNYKRNCIFAEHLKGVQILVMSYEL